MYPSFIYSPYLYLLDHKRWVLSLDLDAVHVFINIVLTIVIFLELRLSSTRVENGKQATTSFWD